MRKPIPQNSAGFTPWEKISREFGVSVENMDTQTVIATRRASPTGFTLIETMVAITILTLAMAGPLFTASRAIVAAQTARDQLTALYLAEEGIEYVRMMRDNQYLAAYTGTNTNAAGVAWDHFLNGNPNPALNGRDPFSIKSCIKTATNASSDDNVCSLDSAILDPLGIGLLQRCTGGTCASRPLHVTGCERGESCAPSVFTSQNTIAGSVKTAFVREIQSVPISADEHKIVATVTWVVRGTTRSYTVTVFDHLTAWQ